MLVIDPQLVGGLLFTALDPAVVADRLAEALAAPNLSSDDIVELGLDPALARIVWNALPHDPIVVREACRVGAAWVLGQRSVRRDDDWEAVASLPPTASLPPGLRRTTAETLIGLIGSATRKARLAAPYMDNAGLDVVADAVIAASLRGVSIDIFHPPNWDAADSAITHFKVRIREEGEETRLRIMHPSVDAPWAHLKVVTVDGQIAYIGSANMTGAGLTGRNVELGVVVHGKDVVVIDAVLDALIG